MLFDSEVVDDLLFDPLSEDTELGIGHLDALLFYVLFSLSEKLVLDLLFIALQNFLFCVF